MDNILSQLLDLVRQYKMPPAAAELLTANSPLILTGTTGSGKDAIEDYIQKISSWRHVVTHTTRPMRPGEQNGIDYWFVDEAEMLKLVGEQAFIEVKFIHDRQVSGSSLNAYSSTLQSGYKPLMRIDVQGIQELHQHAPGIRPVFILPPSFEAWMERLEGRGRMSHVEKVQRMHSARRELEIAIQNERFILVVNDEIPRVSREILDGTTDAATQYRNRELAQRLIDHIKAY